jgi:hypothetical protein
LFPIATRETSSVPNVINTGKTAEQAADAAQERSVALLRGR